MSESGLQAFIDWTSVADADQMPIMNSDERRKLEMELDVACVQAYAAGSSGLIGRGGGTSDRLEKSIGRHVSWLIGMAERYNVS
jgi:hypothetical protein